MTVENAASASQNDEGAAAAAAAAGNAGGDQGNGAGAGAASKPTWIEQLPGDMRADETLYGYKTIADLVKANKDLTAKGSAALTIPGENATAEERAAFAKAIGVPGKPEEYTDITKPEGYPEEFGYDPAMEQEFKTFMHSKNVPAGTAKDIWQWYHGMVMQGADHDKKTMTESVDKLKTEWGMKYTENMETAVRAFKMFGPDAGPLMDQTVQGGIKLGNHPSFLKLFLNIGKAVSDDMALQIAGSLKAGEGAIDDEKKALEMFPSMAKKE